MNLRTRARLLVLLALALCVTEIVFCAEDEKLLSVSSAPGIPSASSVSAFQDASSHSEESFHEDPLSVNPFMDALSKSVLSVKTDLVASPCTGTLDFYCGEDAEQQCISSYKICDNIHHCSNGRDEQNCVHECPANHYMCRDGGCISMDYHCNGQYECMDGSDEQDCGEVPKEICAPPNNFFCKIDNVCISSDLRCNGEKNCVSGEDEVGCPRNKCSEKGSFACGQAGFCISARRVCDGNDDCPGGSDERDCSDQLPSADEYLAIGGCKIDEFQCLDGACISHSKVCNNIFDCKGGEDEGGLCGKCEGHGCGVKCSDYPSGPKCSCPSEMTLAIDEKSCHRPNLCEVDGNRCAHHCVQEDGQFMCICAEGYVLNGTSCRIGEEHRNGDLFFINGDRAVRKSNIFKDSGSIYEDFVVDVPASFHQVTSLAFDQVNQSLYYVAMEERHHFGSIFLKANGSESTELFGGHGLKRVAYDWIAGNLYYASTGLGIGVCSADGRYCSHLVTGPRYVQSELVQDFGDLIVYPKKGLLIWLEYNNDNQNGVVMAAGMDGSKPRIVYNKSAKRLLGLSLDYASEKLYISDGKQQLVLIDLNTLRKEIVAVKGFPTSMISFGDFFYFVSRESKFLTRSRGAEYSEFIHQVKGGQFGISINNSLYYETFKNPCQELSCSHLCVLTEASYGAFPSAKCICPDEYSKSAGELCEFSSSIEGPVKTSRQYIGDLCEHGAACFNKGQCSEDRSSSVFQCICDDGFSGLYCEVKSPQGESQSKDWVRWVLLFFLILVGLPAALVLMICCLRQYPDLAHPVANMVSSASERFNSAVQGDGRRSSPSATRSLLKKSEESKHKAATVVNIPHAFSNPAFATDQRLNEELLERDIQSAAFSPLANEGSSIPSF